MAITQTLFNLMNGISIKGRFRKLFFGVLQRVYYALPKRKNATIDYVLKGIRFSLNANHRTPITWKVSPQYSMCFGRIGHAISSKYPDGVFVDIGANVGDSAAIIRAHGSLNKIICIEGVDSFYKILDKNARTLANVVPLNAFVSASTGGETSALIRVLDSGNAVVYETPDLYPNESKQAVQSDIRFKSLPALLEGHLEGQQIKLLKTDIEGYDLPVLNANLSLIREHLPVVFLELHVSDIDEQSKKIGWRIFFNAMREIGYESAFFWVCSEDFLCQVSLNSSNTLEDVVEYFRNRWGSYIDVALVHKADGDIAQVIRAGERGVALAMRPASSAPW